MTKLIYILLAMMVVFVGVVYILENIDLEIFSGLH